MIFRSNFSSILLLISIIPFGIRSQAGYTTLDRERFSLNFSGTWEIEKDEEFGIDELLFLSAEGGAHVSFSFGEISGEPLTMLGQDIRNRAPVLESPIVSDFSTYGAYSGNGKMIRGKLKNGKEVLTFRFFICAKCKLPFSVSETYASSNAAVVQPGLKIIENSFRIKK